ncbi:BEN domain-containing protein 5 [Frankliniella fusca]|uniref:BEN domain-containing protein 5 n=1 Tax=Frankliniella fusca TaxID=407009 RepID=A0AAE1LCA5_9NEOP|nr:BEN domain-containing protein 5 [Frankliniella fusca]
MLSLALVEFPSERNRRFVVNISDVEDFEPITVDDFDKTKLYKVRWPDAKSFDSKSPGSSQFYDANIILLSASEKSMVERAKSKNERLPRGFKESVSKSESQHAPDVVQMAHKSSKRSKRQVELALEKSCKDRIQKVLQANQAGNIISTEPDSDWVGHDSSDRKKALGNALRKIDFASLTSKEQEASNIVHVTPTKRPASSPSEESEPKVPCRSQQISNLQPEDFRKGSPSKSPFKVQSMSSKTLVTATNSNPKPTEAGTDSERVSTLVKTPTKKGSKHRKKHSSRKRHSSFSKSQSQSSKPLLLKSTNSKTAEKDLDGAVSGPTLNKIASRETDRKALSPCKLIPPLKSEIVPFKTVGTVTSDPSPTKLGNSSETASVEPSIMTPTKGSNRRQLSPYVFQSGPSKTSKSEPCNSAPSVSGSNSSTSGSDSEYVGCGSTKVQTFTNERNGKKLAPCKQLSSPLKSADSSLGNEMKHHSHEKVKSSSLKSKNKRDSDTESDSCSYESSADEIAALKDKLLEIQLKLNTERKTVQVLKTNLNDYENKFAKLQKLAMEMTDILGEGSNVPNENQQTLVEKNCTNFESNDFEAKIENKKSNSDQTTLPVHKKISSKKQTKKASVKKESSTKDVSAKGHNIIGKMIYDAMKGDVPLQSDGKGKVHLGNNVWIKEVVWAKLITSSKPLSILVQNLAEIIWGWKQCAEYSLTGGISPKNPHAALKRIAPAGAVQAILGFYRAKLMLQGITVPDVLDQNVEKVGKSYIRSKFQNSAKKWTREQSKAEDFADSKLREEVE